MKQTNIQQHMEFTGQLIVIAAANPAEIKTCTQQLMNKGYEPLGDAKPLNTTTRRKLSR